MTSGRATRLPLPALLSHVLVAFTIEFDNESEHRMRHRTTSGPGAEVRDAPWLVSQVMWANFMQFVCEDGVRLAAHERRGFVAVDPGTADHRSRAARLTPKGRKAQDEYHRLVDTVEERWRARFGSDKVGRLREILEHVVGDATPSPLRPLWPLWQGMEPYPDGWRASRRKPVTLPHYPMVLHRGGFPDGS